MPPRRTRAMETPRNKIRRTVWQIALQATPGRRLSGLRPRNALFEPAVFGAMEGDVILLGSRMCPSRFWGPDASDEWKALHIWDIDLQLSSRELAGLSSEQQVDYLYQALQAVDVLPANFGKAQLSALMRVMKTNSRIDYGPTEKYPDGLRLLRASDMRPRDARDARDQKVQDTDPTLGWEALCEGPVEVHFVPGDHSTMVMEPHVQELAKKLEALPAASSTNHAA